MSNELETPIGTQDRVLLSAGSVIVRNITIDEKTKNNKKFKIVTFHCKHPDSEDLIKISSVKIKIVQGNNETIKKDALWYNLDKEGKLDKNGNVAKVLGFYNKKTLKEFIDSPINTELDANNWLAIKSY